MLDTMGANLVGKYRVPVELLAVDTNSLGPGTLRHTNHQARSANALYRDGSTQRYVNKDNCLAIPAEAFANPLKIPTAIDQLLTNGDYGYQSGRPADAPRIGEEPE
jgi:hypothetical protein